MGELAGMLSSVAMAAAASKKWLFIVGMAVIQGEEKG